MSRAPVVLRDLLDPGRVRVAVEAPGKRELLQTLADQAAQTLGLDPDAVFDVLWARERLSTTGIGRGIALPHGRVPGLAKVQGLVAKLAKPLAFESPDGRPVDLVFLLLAPSDAGADHLHALAGVLRVLRDETVGETLRRAPDAAALYRALMLPPPVSAVNAA